MEGRENAESGDSLEICKGRGGGTDINPGRERDKKQEAGKESQTEESLDAEYGTERVAEHAQDY